MKFSRLGWAFFSFLLLVAEGIWIFISPGLFFTKSTQNIVAPKNDFIAPDFVLPSLDGSPVNLYDHKGKIILINFWASYCQPCKVEMPAFQTVYEKYHEKGFLVLAINASGDDKNAISFIRDNNFTFPILFDRHGIAANLYHIQALPTSFFIDGNGIIRDVIIGEPFVEDLLEYQVDLLLQD